MATKRSLVPGVFVFFGGGCSPILYVRAWFHTVVACDNKQRFNDPTLKPRPVVFVGMYQKQQHQQQACTLLYTYMRRVITCHGSTAQQQSAFTLEAGPAIGSEALAGTRRSLFFTGGDVALHCTYVPRIILS